MKFTIKDLARGNCIVKNDGTSEELEKVLKLAFPNDNSYDTWHHWKYKYFGKSNTIPTEWACSDQLEIFGLSSQSVKDFLLNENLPIVPKQVLPQNETKKSIDDLIKLLKFNLNQIDMDFEIKIIPKNK